MTDPTDLSKFTYDESFQLFCPTSIRFGLGANREKIEDYLRFLTHAGFQFLLVSNFCLRKFAKVVPFCEPNGPDVDINNRNSLDNSGSNESMQKVLASIV